jgi:C4-type Zn-finger protein
VSIQAPIDPPDEGHYDTAEWDCPSCGELTFCHVWTEVTGRFQATITTTCGSCEYQKTDEDYSYGYDG